jgi:hypothetical protein
MMMEQQKQLLMLVQVILPRFNIQQFLKEKSLYDLNGTKRVMVVLFI